MKSCDFTIPNVIFDDGLLHRSFPSKRHLLYNKLNIFTEEHVQRSLFPMRDTG